MYPTKWPMGNCMFAVWNNLPEELHLALPENLFHFFGGAFCMWFYFPPPHLTSFLLILLLTIISFIIVWSSLFSSHFNFYLFNAVFGKHFITLILISDMQINSY